MSAGNQRRWQNISWQDGVPYSTEFDDIYFSRKGGAEETETVFLASNHFRERIAHGGITTVCELGFGTGLNFLITWQALREDGHPNAVLHFISCDRFPLSLTAMREALSLYPQLENLRTELLDQYPKQPFGHHRIRLDHGRVLLDLVLEEASVMLQTLRARVDAWFLDGFAPSRNPEMWTENLFSDMARLSGEGTTIGTFSAAGDVRRGLTAQGFVMERFEGAGNKRHNMRGHFHASSPAQTETPWYTIPRQPSPPTRIAVIGAGLAGSAIARESALRGCEVVVLDAHPAPAAGASGNPWGLVMPMLTRQPAPQGELALAAMQCLLKRLEGEDPDTLVMHSGVVELGDPCRDTHYAGIHDVLSLPEDFIQAASHHTLSELAGIPVEQEGYYYPTACCVSPRELCERNLALTGIETQFNTRVQTLTPGKAGWSLSTRDGMTMEGFDAVVIANAKDCVDLAPMAWMPLRLIRGQLSTVPAGPISQQIKTALVHTGYLTPAYQGRHVVGATYDVHNESLDWEEEDHQRVIKDCLTALPALAPERDAWLNASQGRVGIRCMTPDQLPAVGPLPDEQAYRRDFGDLHYGRHWQNYPQGQLMPGLWTSIGHGSRGIMTSQFCAELIAAQMFNEPVTQGLLEQVLHPARYLIREFKRDPNRNNS
jgi:tRNA 5-methylaminomethyl-2-thiouridine biosynthesis bifunctional protein